MDPTTSNMSARASYGSYIMDKDRREALGIKTDDEIEKMSYEEMKEKFKASQITIITEHSRNIRITRDLEQTKSACAIAIAEATTKQAAANIAEVQRNRADFQAMSHETTLCTGGRIISLISSVAIFILTIICIIL